MEQALGAVLRGAHRFAHQCAHRGAHRFLVRHVGVGGAGVHVGWIGGTFQFRSRVLLVRELP